MRSRGTGCNISPTTLGYIEGISLANKACPVSCLACGAPIFPWRCLIPLANLVTSGIPQVLSVCFGSINLTCFQYCCASDLEEGAQFGSIVKVSLGCLI